MNVPVDNEKLIRRGLRLGRVQLPGSATVQVLDAWCDVCRRTYTDAAGEPCDMPPELLRGGPSGRKPRKPTPDEPDTSE